MKERVVRFLHERRAFWGLYYESEGIVKVIEGKLFGNYRATQTKFKLTDVTFLAPVIPSKIVCVGLNYAKHVGHSQSADKAPEEPLLFLKPPSSIIGPEDKIQYPDFVDRVDYEAEMGIVIGNVLRKVTPKQAIDGVWGLTCVNDVTARNLQKKDGQWTRAKGFDTFCPVGPWVTRGQHWGDLEVKAILNGEVKQSGRTSEMIFKPEVLISYISQVMTLLPGDLISTGTPEGIDPMQVGDKIEVVVEKVGHLINNVGE